MLHNELSRRAFLTASGAAAATFSTVAADAEDNAGDERPLIIDCHAHLYGEDEQAYPPIAEPYRPPAGKGTVAHLREEMRANGVRRAVAIHTFTFYRWDNRFTANASRTNRDFIAGVCTLNPDDTQSPPLIERYVKDYNVRGFRSIPAQSGKLNDPHVDAMWSTCEQLGIVVCVLVNRDKRSEIEALATRHPKLPVVIDHCLNLKAVPEHDATLADMIALAKVPTAHAKLSYLVTGSAEEYPFRDMHPSCREIIKAYGPDRCVWGSDFPCELWCPKATYTQHLRVFTHELGLDEETKHHVLGSTAKRLWFAS